MSGKDSGKLNRLLQQVPEGMLVDAAWLQRHGYAGSLRHRYTSSGWLEQVANQVYRRPPSNLRQGHSKELPWTLVVTSLQTLMGWPGVVGGRTALELQGYAHYLSPTGPQLIHLYGDTSPPGWLKKLPSTTSYVFHRAARLFGADRPVATFDAIAVDITTGAATPLPKGLTGGSSVVPWSATSWPVACSTPERALLELLDELPEHESFDQVDALFQSLNNLRPRKMQALLEACTKVRVNRLFFWFANRHQHRWLLQIKQGSVELGKGKRVIVRGGRLDTKFNITVPRDMHAVEQ